MARTLGLAPPTIILEGRTSWVATNSDASAIIDAPVSLLIQLAREQTEPFEDFVRYEPFQGVVTSKPFKALAALSYKGRHGRYPVNFWQTALSNWPADTNERLNWLFAHRLAALPVDAVAQLVHGISSWLIRNYRH